MSAKNKHGNIKCEGCGSYNITADVGYTGIKNEYPWEISLTCNDCGRTYLVGRIKKNTDFLPAEENK